MSLAEIADQAVTDTPGATLTAGPGGRWQTAGNDRRVRGITSVAQGDGAFELGVHVALAWPPDPLAAVADDLRHRIHAAAQGAGLAAALGAVDVHIVTVEEPSAGVGAVS